MASSKRRWCFATKGVTGMGRPLVEDEKKRRQRLRVKRKRGVPVEPIGVDGGKALVYSRLKQMEPGPGYVHFPREPAFDDEYFAQMAAEKLVTKFKGHRPIQEWVQTRARNEALDCLILAMVAMRLSGAKSLQVFPADAASPQQPTPEPPPRQIARRIGRIGA